MIKLLRQPWVWLSLLTLAGATFRFVSLDWGSPWYFHPDERNIASAVVRMDWPDQMNPHFFAYGTVPVYLNFFLLQIFKLWSPTTDPFILTIIIGRFWSALLSTTLIPLSYWVVNNYLTRRSSSLTYPIMPFLASLFTAFSPGFIQYAHFGTFEIWLTFFYLLLFVATIELSRRFSLGWLLVSGLIFGLALGTKVTSLVLFPVIFLALVWQLRADISSPHLFFLRLISLISQTLIVTLMAVIVFFITNPYTLSPKPSFSGFSTSTPKSYFLSFLNPEFVHSINVEGGIARGTIPVFYTRQFTDTVPGLFQIWKVYPWVTSWPVTFLGLIGLLLMTISNNLSKATRNSRAFILASVFCLLFFLIQFIFNSSLYVKWTRYTLPTLPFLIFGAAYFLAQIQQQIPQTLKSPSRVLVFLISFVLALTVSWQALQGLLFTTIYLQPDPRISAASWLSGRYSSDTPILSEVWDMGIVPANPHFSDIQLFNFYELDDPSLSSARRQELVTKLEQSQVFVILSRRLWKNSLDHPQVFPQAARFYQDLFDHQLDFRQVAEFSNPPRLGPLTIPTEILAEETFSVFDHPTVQVWEKLP